MTRLFYLFAVSLTVLIFIFLKIQPAVAQPSPQESLQEGQAKNMPQPTKPEVDWVNIELESKGNGYFPHAMMPIPIMPAGPEIAVPVPSDPDEETSLLSGIVAPTPTTGEITHMVHAGETPYKIAQRYGISLAQLIATNNIQNPRRLQIGQVLIIPGPGSNVQVAVAAPQDGEAQSIDNIYSVQRGDSPLEIAQRFGVSVEALMAVNQIGDPRRLTVGQVLTIPHNGDAPVVTVTPIPTTLAVEPAAPGSTNLYVVQRGDNLSRIAHSFGVTIQALIDTNSLAGPDRINAGQALTIPGTMANSPPESPTAAQPEVPPAPSATQTTAEVTTSPQEGGVPFIWPIPLQDGWIAKSYRPWHTGIDIVLPVGTPIRASSGGTVEYSGWNAYGFGNLVVLDHGNGYRTVYADQSERLVAEGDTVAQGDVIGLVGITGRATHPHLHFGILQIYTSVNPCDYLPGGCQQ